MHNGMIRTADEKMSKSLGNIFQLSEAVERFGREAVVAYLSSGHYRQPLEFSEEALVEARARVERIRNYLAEAPFEGDEDPFVAERREAFLAALADDFNTPRAWAAVFELVAEGNRRPLAGAHTALGELLPLLGLESLLETADGTDPEAERLLAERERARAERDFERADSIRDRLAELGWEVRDTPAGARLRRSS
jgi:cysteinyl-tRNA synthetase